MIRWPFVTRDVYDALAAVEDHTRLENYTLRDALREANEEVRRLRLVIGQMCDAKAGKS